MFPVRLNGGSVEPVDGVVIDVVPAVVVSGFLPNRPPLNRPPEGAGVDEVAEAVAGVGAVVPNKPPPVASGVVEAAT